MEELQDTSAIPCSNAELKEKRKQGLCNVRDQNTSSRYAVIQFTSRTPNGVPDFIS